LHLKHSQSRSTDMGNNLKDILNSSNENLPKGLRQVVFERLEREKLKKIARKKFFLRMEVSFFGVLSVIAIVFLGKEILLSDFFSFILLGFSDMKTVMMLWQNYALSLMETIPVTSIVATLLPIFIFMILLRQYGKLENSKIGVSCLSSRT